MNMIWRMVIVVIAAIDGALAAFLAGESFWANRGPGGEGSIERSVEVLLVFAPLSAAICGCLACVLIYRSGAFSLRGPGGNPPLTIWEKGFAFCSAASIAFAIWVVLH